VAQNIEAFVRATGPSIDPETTNLLRTAAAELPTGSLSSMTVSADLVAAVSRRLRVTSFDKKLGNLWVGRQFSDGTTGAVPIPIYALAGFSTGSTVCLYKNCWAQNR
jgi:hypothetical protein